MITRQPSWVTRFLRKTVPFSYAGENHLYALMSADFAATMGTNAMAAPRIFTICKDGVLAVSDEYPEDKRELGLIHELIEYSLPQNEFCCLEALKTELVLAEERGFNVKEYLSFRKDFFENLFNYYDAHDDFPGRAEIVAKLRHSRDYLRTVA